jgi:hypothetical protein
MNTYLSHFQPIIDDVLERTHLHLADELRLDHRLVHYERHQLVEVGQDQLRLVVRRRSQRGHGMAANLHLGIVKRSLQHINQGIPEECIKRLVVVRKSVPERLDGDGPQHRRLVSEQGLLCISGTKPVSRAGGD